jgi:hypothetical protein
MIGRTKGLVAAAAFGLGLWPAAAEAKPFAPGVFCTDAYPEETLCAVKPPPCEFCHQKFTKPVVMNAYGADVAEAMATYVPPPFEGKDAEFAQYLPMALHDVEALDSDGDGHTNLEEIEWGSYPGDEKSMPGELTCPDESELAGLDYQICKYDHRYAYRKIGIDFCGLPPTFEELEQFATLDDAGKKAALHAKLNECLDTEFWLGIDGVLWSLAHAKVRPVPAIVESLFLYDYELYTYTQIDDHDVRDLLTAQYLVARTDVGTPASPKSVYQIVPSRDDQPLQPERRVGMMATAWQLLYSTMFTALPRTTAAQMYRSFLGFDIAKSEGLMPVSGEPEDYDDRGVDAADCAACHSTLDPLSYPFATYNGIQDNGPGASFFQYNPDRIALNFLDEYPGMANMPEAGVVLGQPVADLLEWAQVAANDDQFFKAQAADYWKLCLGEEPTATKPELFADYDTVWRELRDSHSVEKMLHVLIDTEAYGAP